MLKKPLVIKFVSLFQGKAADGNLFQMLFFVILQSFDDGDSRLDSNEFLKFVEQNESAVNISTYMNQETNKLLRLLQAEEHQNI